MLFQHCGSCGQVFVPGTEPWLVVDPGRPVPADWLCPVCERTFEAGSGAFVFTDKANHQTSFRFDMFI